MKKYNHLTSINILYANVRGIKKKVSSLESALQSHGTHIATLVETKLGTIPPRIEGYHWLTRNKCTGTGGIAILIRDDLANKVKGTNHLDQGDSEVLWVEVATTPSPTFIGVYYGPQENSPSEEVERQYQTLTNHLITLSQQGNVILTGDFNAKVSINHKATTQKLSRNGKLLEKMLETSKCTAISLQSSTGLWTRVNTANKNEKSVIDYVITPENQQSNVEHIQVDVAGAFRIRGDSDSDHNTILTTLKVKQPRTETSIQVWDINNKEGWTAFNNQIQEAVKKSHIESYEKLEKEILKAMEARIGKKKSHSTKHTK